MSALLGPLPSSDPRFMRRIRIHQAWYRIAVLDVKAYGRLAGSGAPCGSVLPDEAAERDLNFLGDWALGRYRTRRSAGWGVDPVRCTKYLTSSQTLSFNMLAEAVSDSSRCADLFNRLLGRRDLLRLDTGDFEFAAQGTGYALGDKTLLDVLLRFVTVDGGLQVIAVETKLADRFSTRRTAGMTSGRYAELAARSQLWRNLDSALEDNRTRQLARCHALAESIQLQDGGADRNAVILVLTHPGDAAADRCVGDYRRFVANPEAVIHRNWSEYLAAASSVRAIGREATRRLSARYVDLTWSEEVWREVEERSLTRASRGDA